MDILRLKESRWEDLYITTIYGLRLGAVNEGTDSLEDPMITFLREVVTAVPCAAHMSLNPCDGDEARAFRAFYPSERFISTRVGSSSHVSIFTGQHVKFYDGYDHDILGAFFPAFTADDLMVKDEDGDSLIQTLLSFDQPNLYVGVDDEKLAKLRELFAHPPGSEDAEVFLHRWLYATTEIVPVLAGGHDESCYHLFMRSPDQLTPLREPLEKTVAAIRESAWFQENAHDLQWSDETFEWCLVLPCGQFEDHRKCE